MKPDVSVVSVTWNSADCIESFLESVARASVGMTVEVLIVDNASDDDTVERVRKNGFAGTRLIRVSRNIGYSRANNMGIRKARGDYVFLLNPDAQLEPDALRVGLEYMRENPMVAVLAPQMFYPDGQLQPSVRSFPDHMGIILEMTGISRIFPYLSRWKLNPRPVSEPTEVDQPMGAALLMRRMVFLEIGAFDPRLRMFFSDVDLLKRVKAKGYKVVLHPGMRVKHVMGLSTRKVRSRMALEWSSGLTRYFTKHEHGHPFNPILNFFNWAVGVGRSLLYRL
ncbi:MAG: glycosyltransferase family 2 protein [candidate division WOR-3 bacterium]